MNRVDNSFIERAVSEYSDMILRIAYHNVTDINEAEDVMQEVFVKLLNQDRGYFNDRNHLKAWLIRTTITTSINYKKKEANQHKKTACLSAAGDEQISDDTFVWDAVKKLDAEARNIIYLYYYEGYKIKEIADFLAMKENTVSSRLQRARTRLGKILEEEGAEQ